MTDIELVVRAVLAELHSNGELVEARPLDAGAGPPPPTGGPGLHLDLPDLATPEARRVPGVPNPADPEALANLMATTTARLGAGRAGPRPRTRSLLLFQADHGVTQDAIYGEVDETVKERLGLFSVATLVSDTAEYLLRPDLGRRLTEEAKQTIAERCVHGPQVQIVVGAGLSAAAVNHNLEQIYPVIEQGLRSAGLSVGTPFFIEHARVGVINDVGEVLGADVVVILIGERPGLGIADAMSAYLGWRPGPGKTDAHRDLLCMITERGGVNPLEAGAFVVELIRKTLEHQASGVKLRQLAGQD
jgi:ethanolamine ammonia-lyase small subunit